MINFHSFCHDLQEKIKDSYEQGVTTEAAERLAGEFLYAQLMVAEELRKQDLDSRMKKSGLKSIRSAVYLANATKVEKKPSDVMLEAQVSGDSDVRMAQDLYDIAECDLELLQNTYNVFKESHIHFRSIAKGSFGS